MSENIAFLIPKDILRHPSGAPAMYIEHKEAFARYLCAKGMISLLQDKSPEEIEGLYIQWLADNPQQKP